MIDGIKKHALVLAVALLFSAFHIYRLEGNRVARQGGIEVEFDRAVRALRDHLPAGKYQVQITQPFGSKQAFNLRALVINREQFVPRIEAELYVDQQRVNDQRKRQAARRSQSDTSSHRRQPNAPPLRLRVYDRTNMDEVAKNLLQRQLIAAVE